MKEKHSVTNYKRFKIELKVRDMDMVNIEVKGTVLNVINIVFVYSTITL